MKTSFRIASLAALTAATLALPAAAQDLKDPIKCQPKSGVAKCAGKCGPEMSGTATKCGAKKCAPKCSPKCAPKCTPRN